VIPALNAARRIGAVLEAVAGAGERIVVDGGSTDTTAALARAAGARVLSAPRGRGGQLAAGVAAARLPWLLLLHADTVLTAEWPAAAARLIAAGPARAGYFRLRLDSPDPHARRLERAVALRCRALALPYGDQGLLIHRDLLAAAGGIRPLPLMEDVDLIRRLGRARLCALDAAAVTSAERWERDGWLRRSARNLTCLAGWFAGIPPSRLARWYR
jgi:rSAM/selenodomain-associated transferase 2